MQSFPPLLQRHQWGVPPEKTQKADLSKPLSEATIRDLQDCTGGNFHLLQAELGLKQATEGSTSIPARQPDKQIYRAIWGSASQPQMNVFSYSQRRGHAPPKVPAPAVPSLDAWFAEVRLNLAVA